MILKNMVKICLVYVIYGASAIFCTENKTPLIKHPIPEVVKKQISDLIVGDFVFSDKVGQHFLILTRQLKKGPDDKKSITLKAYQFLMQATQANLEWTIKDFIDCQNVDIDGVFLDSLVGFSDIDSNQIIETTVAYFLVCSGGVEPRLTKVIMRQGADKYGIRGESFVRIDEKTSYGGTYVADQKLDSLPRFKKYLIAIWEKAAGKSKK